MIDQNAIVQRYRALPPQAKQMLVQSLTPDVVRILAHVLGPEFTQVAQMFIQGQQQATAAPAMNRSAFGGALQ